MNIQSTDKQYIANTYARFPLTVVGGKGSVVWDENENMYIDLATGIAVNTFGIADDTWVTAVTAQLNSLQHMSNLYYTEPCARLAQMLCQRTNMKKGFFPIRVRKPTNAPSKRQESTPPTKRARNITT